MYVNVVFVIRWLYSAVSLTLAREQRFTRNYYYYYYRLKEFARTGFLLPCHTCDTRVIEQLLSDGLDTPHITLRLKQL